MFYGGTALYSVYNNLIYGRTCSLCNVHIFQAKSLGHGFAGALYLVNPSSLFKFDALSKIGPKGSFDEA